MKELVGKKIKEIYIDADNQWYLKFITDDGDIVYETEGDCCSESWFADVICIDALLGAIVNVVDEVEMYSVTDTEDSRCRQEYDAIYGYKFQTDKGWADIVFRNSSNGYYGGWLNCLSEEKYKAYRESHISEVNFVRLTKDYSA